MSLRFKRNALLVDDDDSFKVGAENADFQTPLVVDQGTEDVNETLVADIEEVSLKINCFATGGNLPRLVQY
jgi:hypothetical protein